MVTLKIQSGDDIIRAYFSNLGFSEKQLPALTRLIDERFGKVPTDGDELVAFIDAQVLRLAKSVFPYSVLPDEQLLAQFRLVFLLCNGAQKCTDEVLKKHRLPEGLGEQMRKTAFETAPGYCFSDMVPQKIESPKPSNFFHNLFHRAKKD